MPSTPSALLNLELQADGENLNAWGSKLNDLFSRMEEAVSGAVAIAVSGSVSLTSTDYVQNQHRYAMLVLSGTGGTVTVPATSKTYLVKNGCSGAVTFTHGSGTTIEIAAGKIKWIGTDGTDFFTAEEEDYLLLTGGTLTGGLTISSGGLTLSAGDLLLAQAPTDNLHAVSKQYADGLAFDAVDLPGQSGQAGNFLTTDGSAASWAALSVPFGSITSTPTTLSGYGITDAQEAWNVRRVTSSDSPVTAADGDWIICDTSSGAIEIDFPAAVAGARIVVKAGKSAATNFVTIDPDGSDTVLGESSLEIDKALFGYEFNGKSGGWD